MKDKKLGAEAAKLELSKEMLKQVLGLSETDAESVICYAVARMDQRGDRVEVSTLEDWGSGEVWVRCYANELFSIHNKYRLMSGD